MGALAVEEDATCDPPVSNVSAAVAVPDAVLAALRAVPVDDASGVSIADEDMNESSTLMDVEVAMESESVAVGVASLSSVLVGASLISEEAVGIIVELPTLSSVVVASRDVSVGVAAASVAIGVWDCPVASSVG